MICIIPKDDFLLRCRELSLPSVAPPREQKAKLSLAPKEVGPLAAARAAI